MAERYAWAYFNDRASSMLVLHDRVIYLTQLGKPKEIKAMQHKIAAGVHPAAAGTDLTQTIRYEQVRQVRRHHSCGTIEIEWVDDTGRECEGGCGTGTGAAADTVLPILLRELAIPDNPTQENEPFESSILVPLTAAGIPLLMLGIVFTVKQLSSPEDWARESRGKAALFKAIANALGDGGMIAVMAGIVVVLLAYWCFRAAKPHKIDIWSR
jgi:hypothetical protein